MDSVVLPLPPGDNPRVHIENLLGYKVASADMLSGYVLVERPDMYETAPGTKEDPPYRIMRDLAGANIYDLGSGKFLFAEWPKEITNWGNGLFRVVFYATYPERKEGLYSLKKRDYLIAPGSVHWAYLAQIARGTFVAVYENKNVLIGVYSPHGERWLVAPDEGCVLHSLKDGSAAVHAERFFVTTQRETGKQGFYCLSRGPIFKAEYDSIDARCILGALVVRAKKGEMEECFLIQDGCDYKVPAFRKIEWNLHRPHKDLFIVTIDTGMALYHGGRRAIVFEVRGKISHWKGDIYHGVSEPDDGKDPSTAFYTANGEEERITGYRLVQAVDDDRWLIQERGRFGLFSRKYKKVLIPAEFRSLAHVYENIFLGTWLDRPHVVDLDAKVMPLLLLLGGDHPSPPLVTTLRLPPPRTPDPDTQEDFTSWQPEPAVIDLSEWPVYLGGGHVDDPTGA